MVFRRATDHDYSSILTLQDANLFENLSEEARQEGYLSARFSVEQFQQMNRDAAIVVAQEAGRIAGYACSAAVEDSRRYPILAAMIATFGRIAHLDMPLDDDRVCIYGPVCVERNSRGQGIFRKLIHALKLELAGRYDIAAAFIAKSNTRSLAAHVDGLGMNITGEFEYAGKFYWIVCFKIPAADLACCAGPRK